jgi:NAD+ kinase
VLLVDGDATGGPAVAPDDVEAAVGAVIDRDRDPDRAVPTVSQPRLEVWTPRADRTAALDVTLQTVEPARISEFGVRLVDDGRTPDTGESDRRPDRSAEPGERLARLRADGVVVATPAGSHGYPRSAGGPRLVGGRAAVVVPIAPFVVDPDTWVTPLSDRRVRVTVERDEATVGLFVDGHEVGTVDHDTPVVIGDDGDLRLVDGRRLERH